MQLLGRGRIDNLVKDNFDFEDWTPIDSSDNRRSRDIHTDASNVQERTIYTAEGQRRQREVVNSRKQEFADKKYFPQEEIGGEVGNEILDDIDSDPARLERDCEIGIKNPIDMTLFTLKKLPFQPPTFMLLLTMSLFKDTFLSNPFSLFFKQFHRTILPQPRSQP